MKSTKVILRFEANSMTKEVCAGCGLKRICAASAKDGQPVCSECKLFEDIVNSSGIYNGGEK